MVFRYPSIRICPGPPYFWPFQTGNDVTSESCLSPLTTLRGWAGPKNNKRKERLLHYFFFDKITMDVWQNVFFKLFCQNFTHISFFFSWAILFLKIIVLTSEPKISHFQSEIKKRNPIEFQILVFSTTY